MAAADRFATAPTPVMRAAVTVSGAVERTRARWLTTEKRSPEERQRQHEMSNSSRRTTGRGGELKPRAPHEPWASEQPPTSAPPLTFAQVHAVNTSRCRRWHEESAAWTGADWATALAGECGEALNIVKKLRRVECGMRPGPNDPPVTELGDMLAAELADVFLYLDLLAWHYGIDLPYAIVSKFNRVSALQDFPEMLPWPEAYR
jgi:NTP pyrophosphatase (non-canonical NTP hydrolase)